MLSSECKLTVFEFGHRFIYIGSSRCDKRIFNKCIAHKKQTNELGNLHVRYTVEINHSGGRQYKQLISLTLL